MKGFKKYRKLREEGVMPRTPSGRRRGMPRKHFGRRKFCPTCGQEIPNGKKQGEK